VRRLEGVPAFGPGLGLPAPGSIARDRAAREDAPSGSQAPSMLRLRVMIVVLFLIFFAVAAAAAAFVAVPVFRGRKEATAIGGRAAYAIAGAALVVVVGLGTYFALDHGNYRIALTSLTGPGKDDYVGLIAMLAREMPSRPGDAEGWTLLGRGYLALNDPDEAQKALARAVDLVRAQQGKAPPDLLSAYGQAMAEAAGGVTKEAEAVFRQALAENPDDLVSQYYIGLGMASRGDKDGALKMWEAVLARAPADAPWRGTLVDQLAALKAQTGGAAPNPMAMVQQLATRLESNPNDLPGWLRLIRAYSVLGDKEKAEAALAHAKSVFSASADAQAQLAQAAKDNAL
jgi:cytochrome c-type biogenesis protein CcmH